MFLVYIMEQQHLLHKCHICSHSLSSKKASLGGNSVSNACSPGLLVTSMQFWDQMNVGVLGCLTMSLVRISKTSLITLDCLTFQPGWLLSLGPTREEGRPSLRKDWIDVYAMILGSPTGKGLVVVPSLELPLITIPSCSALRLLITSDHLNSDFTKCGLGTQIAKDWWMSLGEILFLAVICSFYLKS